MQKYINFVLMKSIIFKGINISLLSILLLISSPGKSQSFIGGINAGIVGSQVDGDTNPGYNKFGVYGGLFVETTQGKTINYRYEMKYIQKGSQFHNIDKGIYYKMNLHYAEMQFLAFMPIKKDFYPELGLAVGYLFSATEDDGYGAKKPFKEFHLFDVNLLGGLSYHINEKFKVTGKFGISAIPIRMNPGNPIRYYDRGQYNKLLTLGFLYYIGSK